MERKGEERGEECALCRGCLSYRGSIPPLHHHLRPPLSVRAGPGSRPDCWALGSYHRLHVGARTHTHTHTHTQTRQNRLMDTRTHTVHALTIWNNRHGYCSTDAQGLYIGGHNAQMLIHRDINACTCFTQHTHTHTHTRPRHATAHCTWLGTDQTTKHKRPPTYMHG